MLSTPIEPKIHITQKFVLRSMLFRIKDKKFLLPFLPVISTSVSNTNCLS